MGKSLRLSLSPIVIILLSASQSQAASKKLILDIHDFVCKETATIGTREFKIDIGKNRPSKFVVPSDQIGNGGGSFFIFTPNKNIKEYTFIGRVNLHPKMFEVRATQGDKFYKIKTYLRKDAESGQVETWVFNGDQYIKKSTIQIKSDNLPKMIQPTFVKLSDEIKKCK